MDEDTIIDEDLAGTIGTAVMAGFALMLVINELSVIIQEKISQPTGKEALEQAKL